MLSLDFHGSGQESKKITVLCLGAHCDDIPIGCGGTVLSLIKKYAELEIVWVVFCSTPRRKAEEMRAAALFLKGARRKKILIRTHRDGFLPYYGIEIKEEFERLKHECSPDLILTHYGNDKHQDHRIISDLTWNTYRNHLILEYEIPKYDGDLGSPNVLIPLTERECQSKVDILLSSFSSQREKHWFTEDLFRGLARIRGVEAGEDVPYAEGFYCRKLLLGGGA
jgi:LmbE family N-acetylglucosaminyl deacetylase